MFEESESPFLLKDWVIVCDPFEQGLLLLLARMDHSKGFLCACLLPGTVSDVSVVLDHWRSVFGTSLDDMMIQGNLQSEEGDSPLRTLRERLGSISQEELARRIGASVGSISRWERKAKPMSLTVPQMKALVRELRAVNWEVEDFLESASEYESAET